MRTTAVVVHNLLLEDVHVVHVLQERFVGGQDLDRFDVLLQFFHVALQLRSAILEPGYHLQNERERRWGVVRWIAIFRKD